MKIAALSALALAACVAAQPASSNDLNRMAGKRQQQTAAARENGWIIGCRFTILYTDTLATSDEMQRDLDDALSGEPCRRAVAEISLADRLKAIRDRIEELKAEEADDQITAHVDWSRMTLR